MYNLNVTELGIAGHGTAYRNLPVSQLVEHAIARGEGTLTDTGAARTTNFMWTAPPSTMILPGAV